MSFPPPVEAAITHLKSKDPKNLEIVLNYFNPSKQITCDWKFTDSIQVSLQLPQRKSVKLSVANQGLAIHKNDELLNIFKWTELNVFLVLPVFKRDIKMYLLTKLGGQGPFVLFSGTIDPNFSDKLKRKTKYYGELGDGVMTTGYIGAREGTLYLLKDFVLFGFRKPLVFVMLAEIESISFTLVTNRTFNIVVVLLDGNVYEFEKIDHKDFESIQNYVSENDLNDNSMAEERRAKRQKTGPSELELASKEDQAQSANGSGNDEDDDDDDDESGDDNFEADE